MSGAEYTDKMDAENEALRKDAARYQWLCDKALMGLYEIAWRHGATTALEYPTCHEAIDVAMKANP